MSLVEFPASCVFNRKALHVHVPKWPDTLTARRLTSALTQHPGPLSPSTCMSVRLTSSCSRFGAHCRRCTRTAISNIATERGMIFPSLRLRVLFKVGLKRLALALRLFIFSNVVTISAGTLLALPLYPFVPTKKYIRTYMRLTAFRFSGFVIRREMMSWRLDTSWLLHQLNYWALGFGNARGESL